MSWPPVDATASIAAARCAGYLNQPEETDAVLKDGWFKTGDLATVSGEGFVSIVGRLKDTILRGGYTVAANEVEAVLSTHPDVAEAAVIGVPHPELGEDIAAFVTPGARCRTAFARRHHRLLQGADGLLQVPAPGPCPGRAAQGPHRQDHQGASAELKRMDHLAQTD